MAGTFLMILVVWILQIQSQTQFRTILIQKKPFTASCLEQWSNEVELDDFTPGGNLIHVPHRLLIMRILCHAGCQRKVNVRINYALASDDAWERWPGDIHGGSMTFVWFHPVALLSTQIKSFLHGMRKAMYPLFLGQQQLSEIQGQPQECLAPPNSKLFRTKFSTWCCDMLQ